MPHSARPAATATAISYRVLPPSDTEFAKLQALLVYDNLPSTTAVVSYAIGSRKRSANEQFSFVGDQTVVSLLQTAQIGLVLLYVHRGELAY